jgi:protein required for attachment to host cells
VKTGKVDLKPIPTEITQKVDVEQGDVNLPAIPAEVTQTVDVETGRVNLLNIPEVIEQTVNTHQGELMTAEIAKEITQKINTALGNIVKPEILDEVTQTINTKVGEMITPEVAKEVTQVVNVETGSVDLEPIPTETTTTVDFQADTRNIDAAISGVKKEIATIPVGTIKFNLDQSKLVDLTTLKTLIDEQVKNGLEIDPEATQGLFSQIRLGVDIEDTTWQELIDKINEKLKDLGLDPIKLDLTTGETSKKGREKKNPYIQTDEKGNEKSSLAGVMGGMATGMSEMVSGMENLGIEIPKGFKDTISAVQGVVSILNSIVVIVQAIEAISAIGSIIPFAHGGVVKAANGYVSGTTYSGDQIPAMLNAGEVVLNRSQQGVLAASLQAVGQSGEGGGGGKPYVSGELIWLGLNNYLNRSGRGEIVTSKRR